MTDPTSATQCDLMFDEGMRCMKPAKFSVSVPGDRLKVCSRHLTWAVVEVDKGDGVTVKQLGGVS